LYSRRNGTESLPRKPGVGFTPEGWLLRAGNQWNNGMMEKWNID